MNLPDAERVPAVVAIRRWGMHGLWMAIVLDGSTVVCRLFAFSAEAAFRRAETWAAPRAVRRADWVDVDRRPDDTA